MKTQHLIQVSENSPCLEDGRQQVMLSSTGDSAHPNLTLESYFASISKNLEVSLYFTLKSKQGKR